MSDTTPDQQQQLTRAAHDRLAAELEELTTTGRQVMAERLQRARELGDLSENAEYHETKHEQGLMEARIRRLSHMLQTARIVEAPVAADRAIAGTLVTLRPMEDEASEHEVYLLASSPEERARSVRTVTIASPLGKVVFGKKVGEQVVYQAPGGTFSYEVVRIDPWDGQA